MKRLVLDLPPHGDIMRNSEGDFLRGRDGKIYFAYSCYHGPYHGDDSACDVAVISSADEGETWSEPTVLAKAEDVGVNNIMSVSAVIQQDGEPAFYFLIKEKNGNSTLGRVFLENGRIERCGWQIDEAYYVCNNARVVRLPDGRLAIPVALTIDRKPYHSEIRLLVSNDDGRTFCAVDTVALRLDIRRKNCSGLQEPGLIALPDGRFYMFARTDLGCHYECFAEDARFVFNQPEPSQFTAPCSPMGIFRDAAGAYYVVYNPIPDYNGRKNTAVSWARTPLVIRKSTDGIHYGDIAVIEDDELRGYCYPAAFFTEDNGLLLAYCRGGVDEVEILQRLGIMKMDMADLPKSPEE